MTTQILKLNGTSRGEDLIAVDKKEVETLVADGTWMYMNGLKARYVDQYKNAGVSILFFNGVRIDADELTVEYRID